MCVYVPKCNNSLFKNNIAKTNAGAIAIVANTQVVIENTSFIDNTSEASGAAVYLAGGAATIKKL